MPSAIIMAEVAVVEIRFAAVASASETKVTGCLGLCQLLSKSTVGSRSKTGNTTLATSGVSSSEKRKASKAEMTRNSVRYDSRGVETYNAEP